MEHKNSQILTFSSPVQFAKGIGPKRAEILAKAGIFTVEDLVRHYPRRYLDRSKLVKIRDLRPKEKVTVAGEVLSCGTQRGRKSRYIVMLGDGTGILHCVWFKGLPYISKVFRAGQMAAFSGTVTTYRGLQLVHPEYDLLSDRDEANPLHTGGIIPLYPSTEGLGRCGLDSRGFRRILAPLLHIILPTISDPLPPALRDKNKLLPLTEALEQIHYPSDWKTLEKARKRLVYDELFLLQIGLNFERSQLNQEESGLRFTASAERVRTFIDGLPFSLTAAQKRALTQIHKDMQNGRPMNRMLQGDVGCGKTLVAVICMLLAVENGYQAALMAPTEILAEQHFITLSRLLADLKIRITLVTGGVSAAERQRIREDLKSGNTDLAIGTHALVQEGVEFSRLGCIIVDEQHRFGVMQRASLRLKGDQPHVLVMTATPIPRTLALTLYGDLDVSVIDELPAGRKPVRTAWRRESSRDAIYQFIRDELVKKRQVYIVYPLVEESEKIDLADATAAYEDLSHTQFKDFTLALLHGRMKQQEKDEVMQRFARGEVDILVTTTVIEVGVDVPNATVMLVEHADRFGLTQLHQLRGRIGRGDVSSTCILLTEGHLGDAARTRMEIMSQTNDGFIIAEKDLELRGPGDILGVQQHGQLPLKLANIVTDGPLIEQTRKDARGLLNSDPALQNAEHSMLRQLLADRNKKEGLSLLSVG